MDQKMKSNMSYSVCKLTITKEATKHYDFITKGNHKSMYPVIA